MQPLETESYMPVDRTPSSIQNNIGDKGISLPYPLFAFKEALQVKGNRDTIRSRKHKFIFN